VGELDPRLCEILAFTLTLISACRCMSSDLSRVASQFYVSYAAFGDLSHHLCISRCMVVALVLSRLDYGNVTLAGLPTNVLSRLQSVINAAARSIAGLRRSEHITIQMLPSPASFHCMASSARAHQVQTGGPCAPSSSRHCTSVLIGPASVHRRFAVETSRPAALVDLQSP